MTRLGEPVEYDGHGAVGYPTERWLCDQVAGYLGGLNPGKRYKALMSQQMYGEVLDILQDPSQPDALDAQFRFWCKRQFRIVEGPSTQILVAENRPVAVIEQLYSILVGCHGDVNHGGRDKTSAQVRRFYSWVPKEIVSRFVKGCPSCQKKRKQAKPEVKDLEDEDEKERVRQELKLARAEAGPGAQELFKRAKEQLAKVKANKIKAGSAKTKAQQHKAAQQQQKNKKDALRAQSESPSAASEEGNEEAQDAEVARAAELDDVSFVGSAQPDDILVGAAPASAPQSTYVPGVDLDLDAQLLHFGQLSNELQQPFPPSAAAAVAPPAERVELTVAGEELRRSVEVGKGLTAHDQTELAMANALAFPALNANLSQSFLGSSQGSFFLSNSTTSTASSGSGGSVRSHLSSIDERGYATARYVGGPKEPKKGRTKKASKAKAAIKKKQQKKKPKKSTKKAAANKNNQKGVQQSAQEDSSESEDSESDESEADLAFGGDEDERVPTAHLDPAYLLLAQRAAEAAADAVRRKAAGRQDTKIKVHLFGKNSVNSLAASASGSGSASGSDGDLDVDVSGDISVDVDEAPVVEMDEAEREALLKEKKREAARLKKEAARDMDNRMEDIPQAVFNQSLKMHRLAMSQGQTPLLVMQQQAYIAQVAIEQGLPPPQHEMKSFDGAPPPKVSKKKKRKQKEEEEEEEQSEAARNDIDFGLATVDTPTINNNDSNTNLLASGMVGMTDFSSMDFGQLDTTQLDIDAALNSFCANNQQLDTGLGQFNHNDAFPQPSPLDAFFGVDPSTISPTTTFNNNTNGGFNWPAQQQQDQTMTYETSNSSFHLSEREGESSADCSLVFGDDGLLNFDSSAGAGAGDDELTRFINENSFAPQAPIEPEKNQPSVFVLPNENLHQQQQQPPAPLHLDLSQFPTAAAVQQAHRPAASQNTGLQARRNHRAPTLDLSRSGPSFPSGMLAAQAADPRRCMTGVPNFALGGAQQQQQLHNQALAMSSLAGWDGSQVAMPASAPMGAFTGYDFSQIAPAQPQPQQQQPQQMFQLPPSLPTRQLSYSGDQFLVPQPSPFPLTANSMASLSSGSSMGSHGLISPITPNSACLPFVGGTLSGGGNELSAAMANLTKSSWESESQMLAEAINNAHFGGSGGMDYQMETQQYQQQQGFQVQAMEMGMTAPGLQLDMTNLDASMSATFDEATLNALSQSISASDRNNNDNGNLQTGTPLRVLGLDNMEIHHTYSSLNNGAQHQQQQQNLNLGLNFDYERQRPRTASAIQAPWSGDNGFGLLSPSKIGMPSLPRRASASASFAGGAEMPPVSPSGRRFSPYGRQLTGQ